MSDGEVRQLGQHIRHLREQQGLGVRELAKKAGVSPGGLTRIEHGKRCPQSDTLKALATALDAPLSDLLIMAGHVTASDLPGISAYLRMRYRHLPQEKLRAIDNYCQRIIDEYGCDPRGNRHDKSNK